jgi:alpha-beta hydrolase superfamily lysophospholipase
MPTSATASPARSSSSVPATSTRIGSASSAAATAATWSSPPSLTVPTSSTSGSTSSASPTGWESFRLALYKELGDPAVDGEYLHKISPLFHAGNINKPLLVLQGANDPRVLQVESDEMVEAARANGAPVEYIVFDDEGHGFRKKKNREEGYGAILKFLDRHLGEAPELRDDSPPA